MGVRVKRGPMAHEVVAALGWSTLAVMAIVLAFVLGRASVNQRAIHARAYEEGLDAMVEVIAGCTLEMAAAGQCWIPCGGDSDCLAKNGRKDH